MEDNRIPLVTNRSLPGGSPLSVDVNRPMRSSSSASCHSRRIGSGKRRRLQQSALRLLKRYSIPAFHNVCDMHYTKPPSFQKAMYQKTSLQVLP